MPCFPPLWSALTPAIQQIPTEQPRLPYSQIPALPVPVSAAAFSTQFSRSNKPLLPLRQPPGLRSPPPVGCRWTPVYHVKVGDNNPAAWRKHWSYGRLKAHRFPPLHPGLLTASLLRSRWPNSGHGRQEFLVPLYPRRYSGCFCSASEGFSAHIPLHYIQ